jgi:hypothetical protein
MTGREQPEWSRFKEVQRVSRERRAVLRQQRMDQLRVNATPETLRKLQRPVIDRLLGRGQIGEEQHRAAKEIEHVWVAITAALFPRISDPSGKGRLGTSQDWSAALQTAYGDRYQPWRDEAASVEIGHRRSLADLVFMLAVDNYGPRQIALMWHMDQRRVLHLIRTSLWRYAELAGWTDRPFLPAFVAPPDYFRLTVATSQE